MIRVATLDDIERIVEIGKVMHQESAYKDLPFDAEKVSHLMAGLIDGAGVVFVAERAGHIIGGFAGGISEFWFCTSLHAFDFGLFILPEHRGGSAAIRLLAAFEHWAKDSGAVWCDVGITTGVHLEQSTRLYEKLGYNQSGILFRKEVM